jgi:hypothetical protein
MQERIVCDARKNSNRSYHTSNTTKKPNEGRPTARKLIDGAASCYMHHLCNYIIHHVHIFIIYFICTVYYRILIIFIIALQLLQLHHHPYIFSNPIEKKSTNQNTYTKYQPQVLMVTLRSNAMVTPVLSVLVLQYLNSLYYSTSSSSTIPVPRTP